MGRRQGKLTRTLLGALFSFWVGSFLGVSMAQAAEAEVVIAVSGSSKPFAYENEQGQTEGFNFDLANLICGKLKKACRVEIMPFADVLAGVSEGKVSIAIANLLKTPEREKVMLFSKPIWRSTTSLIGPYDLPYAETAAVKGRFKICAIDKSRQWSYIDGLDGPKENLVAYPRITELFDALVDQKCTLAIMPTVSALQFLTSSRGRDFDYYSAPLTDPQLSGTVHIALSKQAPELVTEVDAVMEELQNDGSYRSLIFRYFPFDIL
jgi:ABC-type amino acid transport substrate-binding protein